MRSKEVSCAGCSSIHTNGVCGSSTLENKMKCGLGKCARCNMGDKYVCKDGPVFTFAQISNFLERV